MPRSHALIERVVVFFIVAAVTLAAGCDESPGRRAAPSIVPTARAAGDGPAVTKPAPAAARTSPAEFREVTFDDIKLDMEKGAPFTRSLLPKRVTALASEPIRIRGYILPSFQQTGLTQFVLVRDNQECCFGPGAALHDCIVVRMRPGKSTSFSIRPVAVAGTFRIDELKGPDGNHLAIYALDGEEVQ